MTAEPAYLSQEDIDSETERLAEFRRNLARTYFGDEPITYHVVLHQAFMVDEPDYYGHGTSLTAVNGVYLMRLMYIIRDKIGDDSADDFIRMVYWMGSERRLSGADLIKELEEFEKEGWRVAPLSVTNHPSHEFVTEEMNRDPRTPQNASPSIEDQFTELLSAGGYNVSDIVQHEL